VADINLCGQVLPAPDVSVCRDPSEYDVWLRVQVTESPGVSVYPTEFPLVQAATGPAVRTFTLSATEGSDVASLSAAHGFPVALAGTEAADTLAAQFKLGHPFALSVTENADTGAWDVTVTPAVSGTETLDLSATEDGDSAAFDLSEIGLVRGGAFNSGGWIERESPYVILRRKLEAERRRLAIPVKASSVIERVAREQAGRAEVINELARTQELVTELERAGIAWKRSYDAALTAYRDYLLTAEISVLLAARGIYAELDKRETEYYDAAVTLLLLQEH
jgi:hypothetical protein